MGRRVGTATYYDEGDELLGITTRPGFVTHKPAKVRSRINDAGRDVGLAGCIGIWKSNGVSELPGGVDSMARDKQDEDAE